MEACVAPRCAGGPGPEPPIRTCLGAPAAPAQLDSFAASAAPPAQTGAVQGETGAVRRRGPLRLNDNDGNLPWLDHHRVDSVSVGIPVYFPSTRGERTRVAFWSARVRRAVAAMVKVADGHTTGGAMTARRDTRSHAGVPAAGKSRPFSAGAAKRQPWSLRPDRSNLSAGKGLLHGSPARGAPCAHLSRCRCREPMMSLSASSVALTGLLASPLSPLGLGLWLGLLAGLSLRLAALAWSESTGDAVQLQLLQSLSVSNPATSAGTPAGWWWWPPAGHTGIREASMAWRRTGQGRTTCEPRSSPRGGRTQSGRAPPSSHLYNHLHLQAEQAGRAGLRLRLQPPGSQTLGAPRSGRDGRGSQGVQSLGVSRTARPDPARRGAA